MENVSKIDRQKEIVDLLSSFDGVFIYNVNISGWDIYELDKNTLLNKMMNQEFKYDILITEIWTALSIDFNPSRDYDFLNFADYPKEEIYELHFPSDFTLKLIANEKFASEGQKRVAIQGAKNTTIYKDYLTKT